MTNPIRRTLAVLSLLATFGSALAQTPPTTDATPAPEELSRPKGALGAAIDRRPMASPGDDLRWVLQPRVATELGLTSLQIEKIRALLPAPRPDRADRPGGPRRSGRPEDRGPVGGPGDERGPEDNSGKVRPPVNGGDGAGGLGAPGVLPPRDGQGNTPTGAPAVNPPVAPAVDSPTPRAGTGRHGDGTGRSGDPKAMEGQLRSILRPVQFERYHQLRLQRERLGDLTRNGFADDLGLTSAQREKLNRMLGRAFEFGEEMGPGVGMRPDRGPGLGGPGNLPPVGTPPEGGRPLSPDGERPPAGGSTPPPAATPSPRA